MPPPTPPPSQPLPEVNRHSTAFQFGAQTARAINKSEAVIANSGIWKWWEGQSKSVRGIIAGSLAFMFFVFMVLISSSIDKRNSGTPRSESTATGSGSSSTDSKQGAGNDTSSQAKSFASETPAVSAKTHLADAKKALADNYHPTGANKSWGRVKDARDHLEQIRSTDKEYPEAQKLLREVKRREDDIEVWANATARKLYADEFERKMLSQGMDMSADVSGTANTTLKIRYVLINRAWVYQFQTNVDVMSTLRKAGFKKLILTDGYYLSWTIEL